jgi:predicted Zn finger-like uncharacterized protein
MYTQCTHCQAIFRVTTAELTASDGNVRCGECGRVFNGLETLSVLAPENADTGPAHRPGPDTLDFTWPDTQQDDGPTPTAQVDQPDATPQLPVAVGPSGPVSAEPAAAPKLTAVSPAGRADGAPVPGHDAAMVPEGAEAPYRVPLLVIRDEVASAAAQHTPRFLLSTLSMGVLSLLLIALLAGQVIYHERNRLAAYPEASPLLQWMCNRLDCDLPVRRDPDAFRLSSRNIYSHPNASGALMVQATLANQADFAQPHPLVELSFRDLQGELLAVRRFAPEEYLQRGEQTHQVEPGDQIHLHLEIEDPGPRAVAYEFRFH